jgi:hypothetical protein
MGISSAEVTNPEYMNSGHSKTLQATHGKGQIQCTSEFARNKLTSAIWLLLLGHTID